MITKEELRDSIIHECQVCKHLHGKITAEGLDHRFTPPQRSTLELLRHLSITGIAPMKMIATGSRDVWKEYQDRAKEMTAEEFPARMDEQIEEIRAFFEEVSEEEFRTKRVSLPTGREVTLAMGVLESSLKWMVGYRMQLFLQIKASGVEDINTSNNWRGADWKPQQAAAENSTEEVAEETAG